MKTYINTRRTNPGDLFGVFDDFFRPVFSEDKNCLKTNIRELDDSYELDIEVPGFTKDQIKISLKEGYLSVVCSRQDKEVKGNYKRKEICESCARSYYIGEGISQDSVKAKCADGILTLSIPKEQPKQVETSYIAIE